MDLFNLFFIFLFILKVKGNSFFGKRKWKPINWDDLNQEWNENFDEISEEDLSLYENPETLSLGYKS